MGKDPAAAEAHADRVARELKEQEVILRAEREKSERYDAAVKAAAWPASGEVEINPILDNMEEEDD